MKNQVLKAAWAQAADRAQREDARMRVFVRFRGVMGGTFYVRSFAEGEPENSTCLGVVLPDGTRHFYERKNNEAPQGS